MLYVPKGCAHGFLTLKDNCELNYIMDEPYVPECTAGILWNSPDLNIVWPIIEPSMSAQDKQLPAFVIGKHYL
jgi:dTDP-4-dehydrorhamnose 3,5-epimerase